MDASYVARPDAAWETVDSEAVVINFETRHYFSLNPTATIVWTALAREPQTIDAMSTALAAAHGVDPSDIRADVADLITALVAEGLALEGDDPAGSMPPVEATQDVYVTPRFEKFGTLEQLIVAGE